MTNSTELTVAPTSDSPKPPRRRAKREIIYAVIGLVLGFAVLPLAIYIVGTLLLGPYAGGKPIGVFFGDFYGRLGAGEVRTWFIALAPYLAIWFVRLCFKRFPFIKSKAGPPAGSPVEESPAQPKQERARREPFIST